MASVVAPQEMRLKLGGAGNKLITGIAIALGFWLVGKVAGHGPFQGQMAQPVHLGGGVVANVTVGQLRTAMGAAMGAVDKMAGGVVTIAASLNFATTNAQGQQIAWPYRVRFELLNNSTGQADAYACNRGGPGGCLDYQSFQPGPDNMTEQLALPTSPSFGPGGTWSPVVTIYAAPSDNNGSPITNSQSPIVVAIRQGELVQLVSSDNPGNPAASINSVTVTQFGAYPGVQLHQSAPVSLSQPFGQARTGSIHFGRPSTFRGRS